LKSIPFPDADLILLLPEQVTIYFLKELISGAKKKIYGKEVRHCTIPQYDNLTIDAIAKFVAPYE